MQLVVLFLLVNKHRLPYLFSGGIEYVADCGYGAIHKMCYFGYLYFIVIVKYNRLSLLGRKLTVDDIHDYSALCSVGHVILGYRVAVGSIKALLAYFIERFLAVLCKALFAFVHGDNVYPLGELGRVSERIELLHRSQVCILHRVLRIVFVRQQLQTGIADRSFSLLVKLLPCRLITFVLALYHSSLIFPTLFCPCI